MKTAIYSLILLSIGVLIGGLATADEPMVPPIPMVDRSEIDLFLATDTVKMTVYGGYMFHACDPWGCTYLPADALFAGRASDILITGVDMRDGDGRKKAPVTFAFTDIENVMLCNPCDPDGDGDTDLADYHWCQVYMTGPLGSAD